MRDNNGYTSRVRHAMHNNRPLVRTCPHERICDAMQELQNQHEPKRKRREWGYIGRTRTCM